MRDRPAQPTTQPADALRALFDEAMNRSLIPFGESHKMRRAFEEALARVSGSATETTEQCGARREHPLSADYYVRCVLDAGHEGEHTTVDGCRWADSSPYGLPATETTEEPEGVYGDWRDDPGNYGE